MSVEISREQKVALGSLLLTLEGAVNGRAKAAFESANIAGGDLEAQKRRALDPNFSSDAKWYYAGILAQRNALAVILGFGERVPHDLGWQSDYLVSGSRIVFDN